MNKKLLTGLCLSIFVLGEAYAGEPSIDSAQIVEIDTQGERPSYPTYQNRDYIKFTSNAWNNGTCISNWAVLQNQSQLSIAMTALVSGKNVTIRVDDGETTRVGGEYCMVTSLVIKN